MTATAQAVLEGLGFRFSAAVDGRTSVADLFPASRRCGVYVLGFATGELYAGQAVDVTRRYVQHRKTHDDVTTIHFQQVARSQLDDVERRVIWALQEKGLKTRNITFSSTVAGETDLDVVMPPPTQARFEVEASFNDATGTRTNDADLRQRLAPRYERFRKRPAAPDIQRLLRSYIPRCVPAFLRTELSFWNLSLPPRPAHVYSRVSVGWQEVLTAYQEGDGSLWLSFHVAASPLELFGKPKAARRALARARDIAIQDPLYEPGGPDQVRILAPVRAAFGLLEDVAFRRAARLLNLRLMRKSATPYGKFHCFALADQVLPSSAPLRGG